MQDALVVIHMEQFSNCQEPEQDIAVKSDSSEEDDVIQRALHLILRNFDGQRVMDMVPSQGPLLCSF